MLLSPGKKIYIGINSNKKILLSQIIYILAFIIYLTNIFFYKTMFKVYMSNSITTLVNLSCICILIFKIIVFDEYTVKEFYKVLILGSIFSIAYFISGYNMLILLLLFIVGAKNVQFKSIVNTYLIVGITIVILAMISAKLGIIEHIIYLREGKFRYSFGSIYATDFASGVFFIIISYFYTRYKKLTIFEIIGFVLLGIFTWYYCDARLDSLSIFAVSIFAFFTILLRLKKINLNNVVKIKNTFIKFTLKMAIPLSALVSIIVTNIYDSSNEFMVHLNQFLNNRLIMGKKGIVDYGFNLFGQKIDMIGNGGTNGSISNYFFIDSSYLHIALRYGLLVLIILCLYYFTFMKYCINNGQILLPIIIIFIGANSMIAHHLIDLAYNPFILVFFADIGINNKNRVLENT